MLLSLVLHMYSMRCVLPAAVLLGTAPTYVLAWGAWRLLSAFLPSRCYHAVDDRLYCIYQSMVLFFFENYTGVQILLYGDLPKNKENIIYLANHQSTVDWIIADILAIRQNALGHVRYVLKDGLKWLPLYGCYFSQHGGIYVKRSAKFNEKDMRNKLQRYMNAGTPMYLVIFPEGTRYNPELTKVISASQTFAAQEGFAVLKHVLTPRIKATHVAFDSMKNYLDAIYDVTVAFEGTIDDKGQRKEAPSMAEFLCKECPKIHIHIDRIDKKDVPEEQAFMRRWLHERFEIKDKLLIEFYDSVDPERRNKFPGESINSKLSLKKTLPSLLILSGLTAGMLMTEAGRKLYVRTWIYGTLIGCLWVCGVLTACQAACSHLSELSHLLTRGPWACRVAQPGGEQLWANRQLPEANKFLLKVNGICSKYLISDMEGMIWKDPLGIIGVQDSEVQPRNKVGRNTTVRSCDFGLGLPQTLCHTILCCFCILKFQQIRKC